MQIVSRLIVPKMKPKSNDGNIRWLEPFANQNDYHDIRYEESQNEEEPEEPLGIMTEVAAIIFLVADHGFLAFFD